MGFFSWKTQDTNRNIFNVHTGREFKVVMLDNKGNKWVEYNYDGYGVFGGKDYYLLLAEMNKPNEMNGDEDHDRGIGINLHFGVSGIKNKETGVVFKGSGVDFFNWRDDKLVDSKGANELLETGEWEHVEFKEENVKFPNLVEDENQQWVNEQPEDCEYQGFFV